MRDILAALSGNVLRPHNAVMQRLAAWIGRRDALLAGVATAIGLAAAYVDSRVTWDDTGVTVMLILLATAVLTALSGRRPWLWALLVGAWVPIFEISGRSGAASLLALVAAAIGSAIGYALNRVTGPK
ncbi:MAG: hypothetical protein ACXWWU_01250 [Candidatus Limnocylindria bacterium]